MNLHAATKAPTMKQPFIASIIIPPESHID
jgi:hypothetical protein